ncbi:MAG: hypothetical protein ACU0C9_06495 [Paracoccaceae bacterium]
MKTLDLTRRLKRARQTCVTVASRHPALCRSAVGAAHRCMIATNHLPLAVKLNLREKSLPIRAKTVIVILSTRVSLFSYPITLNFQQIIGDFIYLPPYATIYRWYFWSSADSFAG